MVFIGSILQNAYANPIYERLRIISHWPLIIILDLQFPTQKIPMLMYMSPLPSNTISGYVSGTTYCSSIVPSRTRRVWFSIGKLDLKQIAIESPLCFTKHLSRSLPGCHDKKWCLYRTADCHFFGCLILMVFFTFYLYTDLELSMQFIQYCGFQR